MDSQAGAMVVASFAADALALGVHWIYDTDRVAREFGPVKSYLKPGPDSYHPSKPLGGFTHYGDQMLVLLESLAEKGGFDLHDFAKRWKDLFTDYDGYYDKATKATLENLMQGRGPEASGSSSTDLAGGSRVAPLVYVYRNDLDGLVAAVKAQTVMTHNNPLVVSCAEFLARTAWKVLQGLTPTEAMQDVVREPFAQKELVAFVDQGMASVKEDTVTAVKRFGQVCGADGAFPSTVHLVLKYEKDLREGMIQNVLAGGDSSGRGMAVGMIVGAHLIEEALPQEWKDGLKAYGRITELLSRLP